MTERKTANNGYQPQVSPSDLHKGYQPSQPVPMPSGEPGAGYQPTGAGESPTNPTPTPPGAE
ncbi:hypothetical protein AB4508_13525 [Vibrio splendidus]